MENVDQKVKKRKEGRTNDSLAKERLEKGLFFLGVDGDTDARVSDFLEFLLLQLELLLKLLGVVEVDLSSLVEFSLDTLKVLTNASQITIKLIETRCLVDDSLGLVL